MASTLGTACVGVACPKCHVEAVVYNGGYWCSECGWRPPVQTGRATKLGTELLAGCIRGRRAEGQTTEREEWYLPRGHELRTHERGAWDQK